MSATTSRGWRDRLKLLGVAVAVFVGSLYVYSLVDAPEVAVTCRAVPPIGVSCSLEHRAGGMARVCWDFILTCQNGTRVVAHDCATVGRGQTVSHLIPAASVPALASCDVETSAQVRDLTVD